MLALINTIFGVICTAFLGTIITNKIAERYQARSALHNIKLKNIEEKIKTISDINIRISKSSASRRFAMQNLINALLGTSDNVDELRSEYRLEVKKWNIDLTSFNIELSLVGFFYLAKNHLEGYRTDNKYSLGIHQNFSEAHNLINLYINKKKDPNLLVMAQNILDITYKETKYISNQLTKESDKIWRDLKNNYTSPLSIDNVEKATTSQLILAIFHPRSNFLRIKSSSRD